MLASKPCSEATNIGYRFSSRAVFGWVLFELNSGCGIWGERAEVLKAGQEVNVKVLKVENGKISLSMKALEEVAPEEEDTSGEEVVSYKDEGDATTGLGALLAGLKL